MKFKFYEVFLYFNVSVGIFLYTTLRTDMPSEFMSAQFAVLMLLPPIGHFVQTRNRPITAVRFLGFFFMSLFGLSIFLSPGVAWLGALLIGGVYLWKKNEWEKIIETTWFIGTVVLIFILQIVLLR